MPWCGSPESDHANKFATKLYPTKGLVPLHRHVMFNEDCNGLLSQERTWVKSGRHNLLVWKWTWYVLSSGCAGTVGCSRMCPKIGDNTRGCCAVGSSELLHGRELAQDVCDDGGSSDLVRPWPSSGPVAPF